jgi:hypothetical protein
MLDTLPARVITILPKQGMEIDRMIARDVFGWSEDKSDTNPFYDSWAGLWRPRPLGRVETPSWSRFAPDTLKVIERMEEMGFEGEIHRSGGVYDVQFTAPGGTGVAHYPNFGYAVCMAALGALGVIA